MASMMGKEAVEYSGYKADGCVCRLLSSWARSVGHDDDDDNEATLAVEGNASVEGVAKRPDDSRVVPTSRRAGGAGSLCQLAYSKLRALVSVRRGCVLRY
jgi:hypothetical protein